MSPTLPLFAQAAAAPGGAGPQVFITEIALIILIFYVLMIRPQQKQKKEHEAALFALHKGDEIVTVGGVVGEIIHIKETVKDGAPVKTLEDRVTIKSGESKLVIHRGRVHQVTKSSGSDTTAA
jgi:preprotein translocase subunit YajC